MTIKLTDNDIDALIAEKKTVPLNFKESFRFKKKFKHKQSNQLVKGANGNAFNVIIRQNTINIFDFSVILAFVPPNTKNDFILRRYNGSSHEHTNKIEGDTLDSFHIHAATERYQERGMDEEAFATPTTRYSTVGDALDCLIEDCGFELVGGQAKLFQ